MKAYVVTDIDSEYTIITWAEKVTQAKMDLFKKENIPYINIRAKRIKDFDKYEKSGIPITDLLERGWILPCVKCGKLLCEDDLQEGTAFILNQSNNYIQGQIICLDCKNKQNSWFSFILRKLS